MAGRWRRFIAWSAVGVLALCVCYVGTTFVQVWRATAINEPTPADAIVVLGAAQYDGQPSPALEGRLLRALELYEAGLADLVVTTGSNQRGDRFTEAFAGYEWLRVRGVPDEAILVVVQGKNTWEQFTATAAVLADRSLDTVLVVSDPYHSYRARLMAEAVGLTAYSAPTDGSSSLRQLARETAGVSLGRVFGFRRLSNLS